MKLNFKPTAKDWIFLIIWFLLMFLLVIILKPIFQKASWCDFTQCDKIFFTVSNYGGDYVVVNNSLVCPICNCSKTKGVQE